jgi:hypothetical protein
MRPEVNQLPRLGEIVMTCAHSRINNGTSRGMQLIKLQGGPRVFANLDDRFFSEWLCFCDDCYARVRADAREAASLIRGPIEWLGDREEVPDCAVERDGARDERPRALPAWFHG